MKKTLSVLLALIMLSILPLNVLAGDLPKSKIVDIDMTNITPRELSCFDGKYIIDSAHCTNEDGTTTSAYVCVSEDYEEYSFVITHDDVNYETVYLNKIKIEKFDFDGWYPANIMNDGSNIDYQDGCFHIYLRKWADDCSNYCCLETKDFKNFSINNEPHIAGRHFNKTLDGEEVEYYLYAKTDKGCYIDFYDDEGWYVGFTQDFETITNVVSAQDIIDVRLIKDAETDAIETENKPLNIDFTPVKNGAVAYAPLMDFGDELVSLAAPDKLFYLTQDNELKEIDTSRVEFPEVDLKNNIGTSSYSFTTKTNEFIYAVESFSAIKNEASGADWSYKWYEKNVDGVDFYILNEETLQLEKLEISIKGYSNYIRAFTTGTVAVITGVTEDEAYVATEYFDGKGTQYETGVNFNTFWYTYIYENSEDLAINEVVLSDSSEYIYITVDGFETLYRLPLGKNAYVAAWTKLMNRIVSTFDEETNTVKYYLLDMSEVYNAIPDFNNPNPVPSPEVPADVSGDGKLSVVDAKWLLQSVAGSRDLTPEQKAVADVNGDGKVTIVDAKWILQAVAGTRVL